jgi:hypothetical protein
LLVAGIVDAPRKGQPRMETLTSSYPRLYSWTAHMFPSGSWKKQ